MTFSRANLPTLFLILGLVFSPLNALASPGGGEGAVADSASADFVEGDGEASASALPVAAGVDAQAAEDAPAVDDRNAWEIKVDAVFSKAVGVLFGFLFFSLPGITDKQGNGIPFIVAWLFFGAIAMTVWMKFINIRGMRHSFQVLSGRYDDPNAPGDVSHFQALSSALSATVGLGNIAGVALAVSTGGPGAIIWMILAAFLGMSSKFVECTLGVKYRTVDEKGHILGGPMRYLEVGLAERGLPKLGKLLAIVFAICCIGGSLGGGNMFQANQAYSTVDMVIPVDISAHAFGIFMMVTVGIVILGGIRRIAATAEKIVPLMCVVYVLASLFIVLANVSILGEVVALIVEDAFSGRAVGGGVLGVMLTGIRRAAFSNEAGIGSAAIAHSAAKTNEPIREGIVALIEPFIDTVIVCFSTAIVIVVSGVLDDPAAQGAEGAVLTAIAFSKTLSWFPTVLTAAVVLFAYSTIISWSYYGERSWTYLFGDRTSMLFRLIFIFFIYVGSVSNLGSVLDFSDLMILSMAFPNFVGIYFLAGGVRKDLKNYMMRLKRGDFDQPGKVAS